MNKREKLLIDLREIQQNEYKLENRKKIKEYGEYRTRRLVLEAWEQMKKGQDE